MTDLRTGLDLGTAGLFEDFVPLWSVRRRFRHFNWFESGLGVGTVGMGDVYALKGRPKGALEDLNLDNS